MMNECFALQCAHHNNHHEGFMNFMHRDEEVNYFPSRFDPVRNSERVPNMSGAALAGKREKMVIPKENNFAQAGERWRSFDAARRDRFVERVAGMLLDSRCTQEIRRIWVGYFSQADATLGQKIAMKLQAAGAL